ncbi:Uncharacterized protein dnm_064400 [Desulfonema magnum]|uniref:Uncharacterized protein n=1 Tax=Desulfonema magnum TaxID=45655 RepID=A0A975BR89_9BACT|nr:Uncharacterized protein dnm_064400 [Desulfonema magnum]
MGVVKQNPQDIISAYSHRAGRPPAAFESDVAKKRVVDL